jgi:hypothetical protein
VPIILTSKAELLSGSRDARRDIIFSYMVLSGFVLVMFGNLLALDVFRTVTPHGRWIILGGLVCGVAGALVLSARVFWRHRINLSAWLLMFGVHASGMALATQLFSWLHSGERAARTVSNGNINSVNTGLLAFSWIIVLLVRGAALLAAAQRMPAWMATRTEKQGVTPRLWLFALYWISPLAWWAGILCAVDIFALNDSSGAPMAVLVFCVAIAATRLAVSVVLRERNRHSNWARRTQGRPRVRAMVNSAGVALAGAVTFYAFFFMAARVQDDALAAQSLGTVQARAAEIEALQPRDLPPKENAETIYKLARISVVPLNWEWAEQHWNTPEARTEVARNLSALSYVRQASVIKGVDYGLDWSAEISKLLVPAAMKSCMRELGDMAMLEARQSAASGDWQMAVDDFRACLRYARHLGELPMAPDSLTALYAESRAAAVMAAGVLQPQAAVPDVALVEIQKALREHFDARTEFAGRAVYFTLLSHTTGADRVRFGDPWPGKADAGRMLRELALVDWHRQLDHDALMASLKLMNRQRMDREETEDIVRRLKSRPGALANEFWFNSCINVPRENLDSMEALRLLETAVAVKRYHRHYKIWPASIQDCMPLFLTEVPPDPSKKGRTIQYESAPPRVYCMGTALSYAPEQHGFPPENYFKKYALQIEKCENGNHILFLGN